MEVLLRYAKVVLGIGACCVFETFKLKSFKEYHDLYLELDTVLLTDVFEQFRESTLQEHKLDPAAYMSLPG